MEDVKAYTGITGLTFAASAPAALLLSLVLLWLYRRAVLRGMALRAAPAPGFRAAAAPVASIAGVPETAPGSAAPAWRARRLRAALVFVAGGLVYAPLATALLFQASELEFLPLRTLSVTTVFFTPFLLILLLFYVPSRKAGMWVCAAFGLCLGVAGLVSEHFYDPFVAWLAWGGVPTLLVAGSLWPRARAVGPLSLAFVVVVTASANLALLWLSRHVPGAAQIGALLGAGAVRIVLTVLLAGALGGGLLAWGLLRLLGKLYASHRLNDQTLAAGAILTVFTLFLSMDLVFAGNSAAHGALAFLPLGAAYLVMFVARRLLVSRAVRPRHLLLHRVFAAGPQGGVLFRALARSFRYAGSIHLIGGPDLATTTLEPDRFLDFLSGRLAERFVNDPDDVERALVSLDDEADLEGRFPVNELYCRDDTWQLAFARLSGAADVILMDLRGFTRARAGASFELAAIAAAGLLARTVLIVDGTTDQALVAEVAGSYGALSPPRRLVAAKGRIDAGRLMTELASVSGAPSAALSPRAA